MENTLIEWADHTLNLWEGCTKLKSGLKDSACDFCYAADRANRYKTVEWGPHAPRRRTAPATRNKLRKYQKNAAAFYAEHGRKQRVFVNSLSDFFDNHKSIKAEWRDDFWQDVRDCPDVIVMLLTKRPQNIIKELPDDWGDEGYPNVWIGTTIENKTEMMRRGKILSSISADLIFWSCEPLLEDLGTIPPKIMPNWVIAGGESGHNARPSHPDWFRSVRDQCAGADVPFLFKQWGEWLPFGEKDANGATNLISKGKKPGKWHEWEDNISVRIGKKSAGRTLDGVVHDGYPTGEKS